MSTADAASHELLTPAMAAADPASSATCERPRRADAQRNRDRVLAAAREAFAERGPSTSLEEIARRAGVGIGTLYRHFPNRQALLEAVYVDEVASLCREIAQLEETPSWEAFSAWLRKVAGYLVTKQALVQELLEYMDPDAALFASCRGSLHEAGEPLLARAQAAGAVRPDASLTEIIKMIGAIAKLPASEPEQRERILQIALDGLRYQPPR
jgi:AcrR family transcriptional regulator